MNRKLSGRLFLLVVGLACLPAPIRASIRGQPVQVAPVRDSITAYDTIAVRGTVTETSPLFVFERLAVTPLLVDSTTIVFVDGGANRLIHADLITGRGWEAGGSGEGPGEFSAGNPYFTVTEGLVFTATPDGRAATFNREGDLIETGRYPVNFLARGQIARGVLREGVVIVQHSTVSAGDSGEGSMTTEIQAFSIEDGLVWRSPVPPVDSARDADRSEEESRDARVFVHARHSTVVRARAGDRAAVVLNPDGSLRGRPEFENDTEHVFVTADEHIWVWTYMDETQEDGVAMVFDRELNLIKEVVGIRGVLDECGDYLLTLSQDRNGLLLLHLLRRRP